MADDESEDNVKTGAVAGIENEDGGLLDLKQMNFDGGDILNFKGNDIELL